MEENIINEVVPQPSIEMSEEVEAKVIKFAGFWRRVVAYLIDALVVGIFLNILERILGIKGTFGFYQVTNQNKEMYFALLVGVLAGWFYYAIMESSAKQATLGKMALGIKVTDLAGQRVTFGRATGRHFAKIISSLILGIGYLMVAFTKKKQGLHDLIAETLVVCK